MFESPQICLSTCKTLTPATLLPTRKRGPFSNLLRGPDSFSQCPPRPLGPTLSQYWLNLISWWTQLHYRRKTQGWLHCQVPLWEYWSPNFQPRWPRASQVALVVKNPPASAGDIETQVSSLGGEGSLEEGMETHCSALPGEFRGRRSLVGTVHRVAKSRTRRTWLSSCAGMLGAHASQCATPFLYWSFFFFIVIQFPLSLFSALVLKSVLSDMSIITLAFFLFLFAWNYIFHPLTLNLYVFFALKWIICRQYIVASCFTI